MIGTITQRPSAIHTSSEEDRETVPWNILVCADAVIALLTDRMLAMVVRVECQRLDDDDGGRVGWRARPAPLFPSAHHSCSSTCTLKQLLVARECSSPGRIPNDASPPDYSPV